MGKEKYIKEILELFKKSPIVSMSSIKIIIRNKNRKAGEYVKQLVRNLVLKGKIRRLTKGFYTMYDDPSLIVFCFKPAYLGLYDALSFHNLWEQETIPVVITSKKVRQGLRNIFGTNVLIKRIKKEYLFGFDYYKQGNFYLPYSDIEKTLIDIVYFRMNINKDVLKMISKKINIRKLRLYLRNYPENIRRKVFGLIKKQKL